MLQQFHRCHCHHFALFSPVHVLMQGFSQWVYRAYDDVEEQAFSSCLSENGSDAEENGCANGTGTVVSLAVTVVAVVLCKDVFI